ncbi:MAG: heparinase II/III family protein [Planctomycetes bacterium]|nr:heparinase II/III family protein [Planctomycetota bacterium]
MSPTVAELEKILKMTPPDLGFPRAREWPAADEAARRGVELPTLFDRADKALAQPPSGPLFGDYIAFLDRGSRVEADQALMALTGSVPALGLAECLERRGRFLVALQDRIFSACSMTSWVGVAHMGRRLPEPQWLEPGGLAAAPGPDLFACMFAADLALLDYLLGDALHPHLRRRIRYEVDRRVFTPFESATAWWHHGSNNWNGVCCGGIAMAAMVLLDSPLRQARILQRVLSSFETFLEKAFEEDGACNEGVGYWNYGLSWFAFAADRVRCRTRGVIDPLGHPRMPAIAGFPVKCEVAPGVFVPFSDCVPVMTLPPWFLELLGNRYGDPGLLDMARRHREIRRHGEDTLWGTLARLFLIRTNDASGNLAGRSPSETFPRSTFVSSVAWLVAREAPGSASGLALAAKGGHNAENHNHNDVGGFAVFHHGEMLIADPGAPIYDADFFGPKRYENPTACSRGHAVPRVNGLVQRPGRDAAARVLDRRSGEEAELLELDITSAYPPEAGLERLVRRLEFLRGPNPRIRVEDAASFRGSDRLWESRLISLYPFTIDGRSAHITGEKSGIRITVDTPGVELAAETLPECRLSWHAGGQPVTLHVLAIRQRPQEATGRIAFLIEPGGGRRPS